MISENDFIISCRDKVLSGQQISEEEAEKLINVSDESLQVLSDAANEITRTLCGDVVDVESLINAKKGKCQEDCSFCSQSAFYKTEIDTYKLLPPETIVQNAMLSKEDGVKSFCLVCAWRGPTEKDFEEISTIIKKTWSKTLQPQS